MGYTTSTDEGLEICIIVFEFQNPGAHTQKLTN